VDRQELVRKVQVEPTFRYCLEALSVELSCS
jgi:hypothetical protein